MTMFVSFLCCTHDEDSLFQNVADKEIQSFFNVDELHSRSGKFETDLIMIVVNTLLRQENLLEAILEYKSQYGSPMWLYSKCVSTPNGLQIFVPVYKADLRWYVNSKGEFEEGISDTDLNFHMEDVVECFHETDGYKNSKFDENRNSLFMFRNLNVLTKGC